MYYDPSGYNGTLTNSNCPGAEFAQEPDQNTAHLYRQMSEAEAASTLASKELQHAIEGAEPTKWMTQNRDKASQFNNYKNDVKVTVVVDFEMNKNYIDDLNTNAVKQRGSKNNPNNKYHYEGLPKPGPDKNFGILDGNIGEFNNNVIGVSIIEKESQ